MSSMKRANRKQLFPLSSQKRTSSKKKQNKTHIWHNMCQSCRRTCPSMMYTLTAQGYGVLWTESPPKVIIENTVGCP